MKHHAQALTVRLVVGITLLLATPMVAFAACPKAQSQVADSPAAVAASANSSSNSDDSVLPAGSGGAATMSQKGTEAVSTPHPTRTSFWQALLPGSIQ